MMLFYSSLIVNVLQLLTSAWAEGRAVSGGHAFPYETDLMMTHYSITLVWSPNRLEQHLLAFNLETQWESHIQAPELHIEPLVLSGASDNRVDLVFFSDGYLTSERTKFIEDARRLAEDATRNQTFYTVKPLLNFWAAFSPSNESGIGVGGVPKEYVASMIEPLPSKTTLRDRPPSLLSTAFGLYRDGTELRAVYYSKPEVARAACASLGSRCDYPILLGNDPFYGGLGGEFTLDEHWHLRVITSSYLNGPLVLRHELGHSIIEVGEEYDGGFAYWGVNAAHGRSAKDLPWKQWLSEFPTLVPVGESSHRVERSIMPLQSYPWTMLNTTTPWVVQFASSGTFYRYLIKFSLSGIPNRSDLKIELDGVDLGWVPDPLVGLDRWHYDIERSESLQPGIHELKFTLKNPSLEGAAQLCSAEVLEFGNESDLYPTFSFDNKTTYRPTNKDCLMRAVTTPNFCKVCMEGLWIKLLSRVNLIDNITESCEEEIRSRNDTSPEVKVKMKALDLRLVPLAHLRSTSSSVSERESYTIAWEKDGHNLREHANQTALPIDSSSSIGKYTVQVTFSTDAVRVEDSSLTSTLEYEITTPCS